MDSENRSINISVSRDFMVISTSSGGAVTGGEEDNNVSVGGIWEF